ncbi:hypothetical protein FGB62_78g00 [Gracilaria domingensis]|nr:hypothetical protein FGB62_78g00 [Gracilaria domingensis]
MDSEEVLDSGGQKKGVSVGTGRKTREARKGRVQTRKAHKNPVVSCKKRTESREEKDSDDTSCVEWTVLDLPKYVFDLCESEGYEYGVQFCKPVTRSRQYGLNVRLRCLRYKKKHPGCGCKAAFMAKALLNEKGWILSGTNVHNHERLQLDRRGGKTKRRDAIRATIKKNAPARLRIPFITFTPKTPVDAVRTTTVAASEGGSDADDFMDTLPPRPSTALMGVTRRPPDDGEHMRTRRPPGDGEHMRSQPQMRECRTERAPEILSIPSGSSSSVQVIDMDEKKDGSLSEDSSVRDVTEQVRQQRRRTENEVRIRLLSFLNTDLLTF